MIKFNDIYNQLLIEGRKENMYDKYKSYIDDERDELNGGSAYDYFIESEFIVETNYKYLDWLLKIYYTSTGHNFQENDLLSLVIMFDTVSPYMEIKDIYQYKDVDLLQQDVRVALDIADEKKKAKELKGSRDVIFESSRWRVVIPKTYEASCHYGQGTKWCTTSRGKSEYFDSYTKNGMLFYLIDKTKKIEDDDIMYRVAANWKYRLGSKGQIFPIDMNRSGWFDAQDQVINAEHIIPLLPKDLTESMIKYYNDFIIEHNDKLHNDNDPEIIEKLRSWLLENDLGHKVSRTLNGDEFKNEGFVSIEGGVDVIYEYGGEEGFDMLLMFGSGLQVESMVFNKVDGKLMLANLSVHKDDEDLDPWDVTFSYSVDSIRNVWVPYLRYMFNLGYRDALDICNTLDSLSSFLSKNKDKVFSSDSVDYFASVIYTQILRMCATYSTFGHKNNDTYKKIGDTVYWLAKNSSSTFKFKYPPREGSMTDRFIKLIQDNPGTTNKEFYESQGREYRPGNNSQFFGSIKDSGIVRVEKGPYGVSKYYIGPNFEDWTKGNLKKYEG